MGCLTRHRRAGAAVVNELALVGLLGSLIMSVLDPFLVSGCDDLVGSTYWQMRSVESSLQLYAAKHKGKFPTTSQGLEVASPHFPDRTAPLDSWGRPFIYLSPGPEGLPYGLISLGEDGLAGGEGMDADIYSWELTCCRD
ncbi:MAG: type II secretion system protein GspG [Alphaproteobacteria bacterium]|nr:type II secretion system protein GspG [Alphaproteobacteria bacterium]MCB9793438.1 type II secretion system protein GspG [Alphaproteobacteria bacterium]